MSESEFNDNQRSRIIRRRRPRGLSDAEWHSDKEAHKRRFRVASKLDEKTWLSFQGWLKANNLNYNSGLRRLISTHPELKDNG
tara:strand:- start:865 stop:1113 length:249 start_codon:yes stop_codon:yes gene_type:complete